MFSKRVLSASLGLCLAAGGCGGSDGPGTSTPSGGATASGSGGNRAGSGGTRANASGGSVDGSAGEEAGGAGTPTAGGATGSNGGTTGGGSSSPSSGDAVPSAGCDQAPEFQSGIRELEVGGLSRSFILDLPSDYDPGRPYPLVFGFHGRDFTAEEFRSPGYGNLPSAAADEAILVHPDATSAGAWELESQVDVEFFDAMLDVLTRGLCVDEARVFATGHSSGGYFTNVLGCQRGGVLRAIAPVAGGGPRIDGNTPECEGPVSVWIAHSEEDEIVPFLNGEGSLDYWLSSDECDAASFEPVDPDPCVAYDGCASGLAVRWCDYPGGHDWPSFAAQGIWDFFKSF